jgi:hypothetical protein
MKTEQSPILSVSVRHSDLHNSSAWGVCKVWEWVTGWAREPIDAMDDSVPDLSGVNFDPKNEAGTIIRFLAGGSTVAFQIEGGIENNDWHQLLHTLSVKDRVAQLRSLGDTTLQIESEGQAVDHWNLEVLKEDLDRAPLLRLHAYRFSPYRSWGVLSSGRSTQMVITGLNAFLEGSRHG